MDKKTFMKKSYMWVAIVTAIVMLIIGLCFGKVIEESLFAEIAKWVVMYAFIVGILEVFTFSLSQVLYEWIKKKKGWE